MQFVKNLSNYTKFLFLLLFIFPFLYGGYYVFSCTVISIALASALLVHSFKEKTLLISLSFPALTFLILTLFYLINRFWAVDSSMAIEGFLKYLCVFLFIVSIWQIGKDERKKLFVAVVLSAALMTVISWLLGLIPALHSRFYDDNEDLHGFFEYANTYAAFLLIALVIILFNHRNKILSLICAGICVYGICLSKSRAVWLLSIITLLIAAFCYFLGRIKSRKGKISFITALTVTAGIIILVLIITGYGQKVFDYLNTDGSLNERYLYYKDAIIYSLHHPFGKGAYAFYFAQPQFQSAYYYAIDAHNDYLQIMLEAGTIPALLFVITLVMQFFSKKNSPQQKLILFVIALHCFVDYDLQFIAIFFILTLCINYGNYREIKLTSKLIPSLVSLVLVGINLVIGISNFCNYIGEHEKSVYFYKNTPSMIILMQSTNQQQVAYDYAQDILNINDSVFEPNNVLSNIYAENEMYDEAVEEMESVIEKDPRTMQHYRDYIDLCTAAEEYYEKGGESDKAQSCVDKILSVEEKITLLEENTDERGIKYGREQDFDLGEEYYAIINSYK